MPRGLVAVLAIAVARSLLLLASAASAASSAASSSSSSSSAAAAPPPDCPADVVLLLDGSTSITSASWKSLVNASSSFAAAVGISADGAHIGVVQFASSSKLELALTGDLDKALAALHGLPQTGGGTNTASGLAMTGAQLFGAGGRLDAPKVVILITDGESNVGGDPVPVASALKANSTNIFGIGVGAGADMKQIAAIASLPSSDFVFELDDYSKLAGIIAKLIAKTCVAVLAVDPSHGPAAGGTVVVVSGYGFTQDNVVAAVTNSAGSSACRFGGATTPVVLFVNSSAVVCRSAPGTPGVSVGVSFAADGASFCPSEAVFQYDGGSGCPTADCDGHGQCVANQCICDDGWTGPNCDQHECPHDCCGHGTCDPKTGTCACSQGCVRMSR